jgi:hypothetical protein
VEAAMIERDPNIVKSGLSRTVKQDGSERTVAEEGMRTFLDKEELIPFRR